MPSLRRVKIHQLRNVRPGCEFRLHRGLNLLLGRNGTGKTTLLQWLADALGGNLDRWREEPYHVEVDMDFAAVQGDDDDSDGEPATMHIELRNERLPGLDLPEQIDANYRAQVAKPSFRSSCTATAIVNQHQYRFHAEPMRRTLEVDKAVILDTASQGSPLWTGNIATVLIEMSIELSQVIDEPSSIHMLAQRVDAALFQGVVIPFVELLKMTRFDESLEFFRWVVNEASLYIEKDQRQQSLSMSHSSLLPRREIPFRLHDFGPGAYPNELSWNDKEFKAFLAPVVRFFRLRDAVMILPLQDKQITDAVDVYIYKGLRFLFTRRDGSIIGHDKLSYGQQRLLAFLYYLDLNPHIVIVDELVNGLHHAWITACMEQIGDRQGILTSQNPLLLDHLSFDSADEMKHRFVLCRSEPAGKHGEREELVWRNPSEREAEIFFRAYDAGIQHVGEILVDQGLW